MIDAYSNSLDRAYSIIEEDDISIDNLTYIENYLNLIPNDWDIICFNAIPGIHSMGQNQVIPPDTIFYKFNCTLYHLHFYIIKNSCLEKIFQNIYPITDQVDILIGNMYNILNIYNITNTVTQKNFGTNIQNNLHVIYNTPVYKNLVNELDILDAVCLTYVSDKLKDNDQTINKNITNKIIDDVIFYNLFNQLDISQSNVINIQNKNTTLYEQLYKVVKYYIKDNRIDSYVLKLIDTIDYILDSFTLHNIYSEKYNNTYKAYSFGCTSSTYLINNNIVKVYNNKLRWTTNNHDNLDEIFKNELKILDKLNYLIDYDDKLKILTLKYMGESLYNNFELVPNWRSQIVLQFKKLSENGIYYSEFNLNNIVVLNGKILFIDFGLAEMVEDVDNSNNCTIFIKLLHILNEKFQTVKETKERHILYNKFMNNIRINKLYTLNVY
jgi:tRNA A-37 threonylcarbamoyl transferase component Bud32